MEKEQHLESLSYVQTDIGSIALAWNHRHKPIGAYQVIFAERRKPDSPIKFGPNRNVKALLSEFAAHTKKHYNPEEYTEAFKLFSEQVFHDLSL